MVRAQQVSDTCPLPDIGLLILKANGPPHPTPASMHLDVRSIEGGMAVGCEGEGGFICLM